MIIGGVLYKAKSRQLPVDSRSPVDEVNRRIQLICKTSLGYILKSLFLIHHLCGFCLMFSGGGSIKNLC